MLTRREFCPVLLASAGISLLPCSTAAQVPSPWIVELAEAAATAFRDYLIGVDYARQRALERKILVADIVAEVRKVVRAETRAALAEADVKQLQSLLTSAHNDLLLAMAMAKDNDERAFGLAERRVQDFGDLFWRSLSHGEPTLFLSIAAYSYRLVCLGLLLRAPTTASAIGSTIYSEATRAKGAIQELVASIRSSASVRSRLKLKAIRVDHRFYGSYAAGDGTEGGYRDAVIRQGDSQVSCVDRAAEICRVFDISQYHTLDGVDGKAGKTVVADMPIDSSRLNTRDLTSSATPKSDGLLLSWNVSRGRYGFQFLILPNDREYDSGSPFLVLFREIVERINSNIREMEISVAEPAERAISKWLAASGLN